MVFALRLASALVAFTGPLSLTACFDVKDAPPLGDTSTGPSVTTEPGTTAEPDDTTTTSDPTTGEAPESSTGPVDPDSSTGPVDPDSSSTSSSSGPPLEPMCGDGALDLDLGETCDDGNLDDGDLCDASCQVETLVLVYTGGVQMLDVPDWVDSLEVEAWGAQGGGSECCEPPIQEDGGLGGYAAGVLPEVGGVTLQILVGGEGSPGGLGGFNGGGASGQYGGSGGGATDVRMVAGALGDRVVVAGGGGGGNCGCPDHGAGGSGGGLSGQAGISNQGFAPGGGGTQAAGGAAGEMGSAGALGQGGSGAAGGGDYHVAGGGGGYYGGGGAFASGAGGGSSYLGAVQNGVTMPGQREGDGEIRLTPIAAR
jgi:cysteine-rich repeat protein